MAEKNIFILEVFDFDFVGIDLTGLKFGCFDLHLKLVDIGVGLSDVFFSFNEMSSEGVELNIESIDLLHKEDDFKCFSTVIFYNFVKLFTIDSWFVYFLLLNYILLFEIVDDCGVLVDLCFKDVDFLLIDVDLLFVVVNCGFVLVDVDLIGFYLFFVER